MNSRVITYISSFCVINYIFQHYSMMSLLKNTNYYYVFSDMAIYHSNNSYIFAPFTFIKVAIQYYSQIPTLLKTPMTIMMLGFICSALVIFFFKTYVFKEKSTSSGSAEWATRSQIKKNLVSPYGKPVDGVICGTYFSGINYEKLYNLAMKLTRGNQYKAWKLLSIPEALGIYKREYIVDTLLAHTFLCAPSRAGKGIGIIIPTLLYYQHSMIVADLKRENLAKTGSYRKHVLGHNVIEFAPTDERPTYRFNPLNEVRWGTTLEESDIKSLVDIIVGEAEGSEAHWKNNAKDLILGVITHLKYKHSQFNKVHGFTPDDPEFIETNFSHVLEFLTTPRDENGEISSFQEQLEWELEQYSYHFPAEIYVPNKTSDLPPLLMDITLEDAQRIHIFTEEAKKHPQQHPVVIRSFSSFLTKPEKEGGSILSTAITSLNIFSEKNIADNTATSDFILGDLRGREKPTDLFLVMPPNALGYAGQLFKIIVEFIVSRALENEEKSQKEHKCLILMDEFPAFGKMSKFIRESGYVASYGLKILFVVQGLEQINTTYKNYEILTNCHVQVYMSPKDKITPKHLSDMFGNETLVVNQESSKGGFFEVPNVTKIEKARLLLTPDEAMKLNDFSVMLFDGQTIKSPKNKWFIDDDMVYKMDAGKQLDKNKRIGFRK